MPTDPLHVCIFTAQTHRPPPPPNDKSWLRACYVRGGWVVQWWAHAICKHIMLGEEGKIIDSITNLREG